MFAGRYTHFFTKRFELGIGSIGSFCFSHDHDSRSEELIRKRHLLTWISHSLSSSQATHVDEDLLSFEEIIFQHTYFQYEMNTLETMVFILTDEGGRLSPLMKLIRLG
jgi:hypothetical protein